MRIIKKLKKVRLKRAFVRALRFKGKKPQGLCALRLSALLQHCTETECLNIVNHLEATLEFQYIASQSELDFAFVKDVIPDVMFFYCT